MWLKFLKSHYHGIIAAACCILLYNIHRSIAKLYKVRSWQLGPLTQFNDFPPMRRKSFNLWIFFQLFHDFHGTQTMDYLSINGCFLIFWSKSSIWLVTKSFFFKIKIQLYSSSFCQEFFNFNCVILSHSDLKNLPVNWITIQQLKYKNVRDLLKSVLITHAIFINVFWGNFDSIMNFL